MRNFLRLLVTALSTCLVCVIFFTLLFRLERSRERRASELEEARWVASSSSWLDRKACYWIAICGGWNWLRWKTPNYKDGLAQGPARFDYSGVWINPLADPSSWDEEERRLRDIPDYVLEYAPLVHLCHQEAYWPSDIAEHLENSVAWVEGQPLRGYIPRLDTLEEINRFEKKGRVFLTSKDNPEDLPPWMLSRHNIPEAEANASSASGGAGPGLLSNAPAVLIVADKGNGIIDAFWFYFYSYNEGNTVFGIRFGNHVGDWEHNMVRFKDGIPQALYLSRHAWGSAYAYHAMEKVGKRPLIFSANGSHAHYPTEGPQPYVLPFSILKDTTSRGPLWDPTLNLHSYTYNPKHGSRVFRASSRDPHAATSWLNFVGRWGDRYYDLGDRRQWRFFGEKHYGSGPTGPRNKKLERTGIGEREGMKVKESID